MIELAHSGETAEKSLHIGLVNNMPDAALEATERQFRTLLAEAADDVTVHLSFFAVPEVSRSQKARYRIDSCYTSIDTLWNNRLDGLIVTGAEPGAKNLQEEPFWPSLTQLMEWANHNTFSSVWSCLAAMAGVLYLDGIRRRPFGDKLFGVFDSRQVADHHLTGGVPPFFRVPHSRWNDIPKEMLSACGYRVLTELHSGVADMFVKQRKNLFVFFLGHPEYESVTLLLEYRRDIRRFLMRERDSYPVMPHGYFDEDEAAALNALRARAEADRCEQSFAGFPAAIGTGSVRSPWRSDAVRFYRNWLRHISEQKRSQLEARPRPVEYQVRTALAASPGCLAHEAEAG